VEVPTIWRLSSEAEAKSRIYVNGHLPHLWKVRLATKSSLVDGVPECGSIISSNIATRVSNAVPQEFS
jgi:hypothetical protein